eukprot:scaffold637_cov34-Prasinocladus_malaysianus.AAC.1
MGRRRRMCHIVRLQAQARGRAGRRVAAVARDQRAALVDMEAARGSGDQDRLQRAVDRANRLGLGEAARAELDAFDSAARAASGALLRASQVGDVGEFNKALQQARKYSRLGGLLGEAQATFGGRVAAALGRVQRAAEKESLGRLRELARAARALGAPEEALAAVEGQAVARDEAAALELDGAVMASPLVCAPSPPWPRCQASIGQSAAKKEKISSHVLIIARTAKQI